MQLKEDHIDLDTFKVANILACLPQHLRQPLVRSLQAHSPNIGYLSMRFEDLEHVDDQSICALIDAVGLPVLVLALSTADEQLITHFSENMPPEQAQAFLSQIRQLHQSDGPEHFFNAFDAKINVIAAAAKLRQNGALSLPPIDPMDNDIPQSMLEQIKRELQSACEKAMADVLACYLPEAAAAILCQRLDRERILTQMLQKDESDFNDALNDEEIEALLCGISDQDVF